MRAPLAQLSYYPSAGRSLRTILDRHWELHLRGGGRPRLDLHLVHGRIELAVILDDPHTVGQRLQLERPLPR